MTLLLVCVILTVRTAKQCLHVWLWVIPMTTVVCDYSEDDIISREPIRFLIMSQWGVSILNDRDWLWFYYLAPTGNQRTHQHCCRQTNHPAMSLFNKKYLFSSLWSYFVLILFSFKQWSTVAWHTGDADKLLFYVPHWCITWCLELTKPVHTLSTKLNKVLVQSWFNLWTWFF